MPARKGLLAPQNTFLDTIATRFDGTRKSSHTILYLFQLKFFLTYDHVQNSIKAIIFVKKYNVFIIIFNLSERKLGYITMLRLTYNSELNQGSVRAMSSCLFRGYYIFRGLLSSLEIENTGGI